MADYTNGAYFGELDYLTKEIGAIYFFEGVSPTPLDGLAPFFPEDTSIGLDGAGDIVFWFPQKDGATDSVAMNSQWMPLRPEVNFNQRIMQSGSGALSVYARPYQNRILNIWLGDLVPIEKRQRLYNFLVNIVQGVYKQFQIEDETGVLYTVRLIDDALRWDMKYWLKYDISIRCHVMIQELP